MLFCPACNGQMFVFSGMVATVIRPLPQEPDLTNTVLENKPFLYCTACPVTTTFDGSSGRLHEIPALMMSDLSAPFVPLADDPDSGICFRPVKNLNGRQDS